MGSNRIEFDSNTNLNEIFIKISSVKNMSKDNENDFLEIFNKYGAVILEHDESLAPEENLIGLKKYFGNIVGHDRADHHGITKIANLEGFDGYLGASNEDHPLHTGGVYSEEPPIVLLLQCIKQSDTGGESILVSSKKIYDFLKANDPNGLEKLKEREVVTIKRGDAIAKRAIFDKNFLKNGSYMFSFRCDNIVEFHLNPSNILTTLALIKNFIDDPKNQIRLKLQRNQILIADNAAVMHARTSFPADSNRCLLRMTLDGKNTPTPLVLGFN